MLFRSRFSVLLLSAGLVVLLAGCTTSVDTCYLRAPRVPEASGFRQVAVIPFANAGLYASDAHLFTAELEGALGSIRVGTNPFFTLVERRQLSAILNELGLQLQGVVAADQAQAVGQVLDVQGLYTGTVRVAVDSRDYVESRKRCVEHEECDGIADCLFRSCKRHESYDVSCSKVTATVTAAPRLIDAVTGQVVYSRLLSETVSDSGCSDGSLPSEEALITRARNAVLGRISKDVAPWQSCKAIDLKEKPAFKGQDRERFAGALAFAEEGRIDRACQIFSELEGVYPQDLALSYNLGVCHIVEGRPDAALTQMRRVDQRLVRPDDDVNEALQVIEEQIRDRAAMPRISPPTDFGDDHGR